MTESEINALIDGNRKRNIELLEKLGDQGIELDDDRSVDHHFWCKDRQSAALLAKELYDRGLLVLTIAPVSTDNNSVIWNVEAGVSQSPRAAVSLKLVEELTRLAAQFESVYDGWGTLV